MSDSRQNQQLKVWGSAGNGWWGKPVLRWSHTVRYREKNETSCSSSGSLLLSRSELPEIRTHSCLMSSRVLSPFACAASEHTKRRCQLILGCWISSTVRVTALLSVTVKRPDSCRKASSLPGAGVRTPAEWRELQPFNLPPPVLQLDSNKSLLRVQTWCQAGQPEASVKLEMISLLD